MKLVRALLSLIARPCPTVCDPTDHRPPGSSLHEISQARILERVAISFSRGSSQSRDWTWVSWIAGRLYQWATREALYLQVPHLRIQPKVVRKYLGKNNYRRFKKAKLEFAELWQWVTPQYTRVSNHRFNWGWKFPPEADWIHRWDVYSPST